MNDPAVVLLAELMHPLDDLAIGASFFLTAVGFGMLFWRIGDWKRGLEDGIKGIHDRLDKLNGATKANADVGAANSADIATLKGALKFDVGKN